jgi:hypothetical protein
MRRVNFPEQNRIGVPIKPDPAVFANQFASTAGYGSSSMLSMSRVLPTVAATTATARPASRSSGSRV